MKKLSTSDVERLSVAYFQTILSKCGGLDAILDTNDRTPLTDGFVDLHASEGFASKATLVSRIPVQVKGRFIGKAQRSRPSFALTRDEIEGFKNTRGAVLLVADIDQSQDVVRSYATVLNPFRLDRTLQSMGQKQKTKSFQLGEIPSSSDAWWNLFNFAAEAQWEIPGVSLESFANPESIFLRSAAEISLNQPTRLRLEHGGFHFAVRLADDSSVPIDIDADIIPNEYILSSYESEYSTKNFTYRGYKAQRMSPADLTVILGHELTIDLKEVGSDNGKCDIKFPLSRYLAHRVRDLELYIDILEYGFLTIGSYGIQVDTTAVSEVHIQEDKEYLETLRNLLQNIEYFGGNAETVLVDSINDDQVRAIQAAVESSRSHQRPPGYRGSTGRVRFGVGDKFLELFVYARDDEGQIDVTNLFGDDNGFWLASTETVDGGESSRLVTPYEFIDDEDLVGLINANLSSISRHYERIKGYDGVEQIADSMSIRLWRVAVKQEDRREEFRSAALSLALWVSCAYVNSTERLRYLTNIQLLRFWANGFAWSDDSQRLACRRLQQDVMRANLSDIALYHVCLTFLLGSEVDLGDTIQGLNENEMKQLQSWPVWDLIGEAYPKLTATLVVHEGGIVENDHILGATCL